VGVASVPGTFVGFVGHSDTSVTPPPYPPVQPEKSNADVEAPLSAVQVASPEPEYPASLQGNPTDRRHAVSRADALAARGGSRQARKAERLRTRRACSAPADQVTATVPPVVLTGVPPSLLLFGMSTEAQVAAAGIGGAKEGCGFV
jgi:hypothetical protein